MNLKQNIIYDFGGVLVNWEPFKVAAQVYPDRDHAKLAQTIFGGQDWLDLDHGLLEGQAFYQKQARATGLSVQAVIELCQALEKSVTVIEPMITLMKRFRDEGYPLYLLSNMSKIDFEQRIDRFEFLKWMQGIVYSADVRLMKPDAAIYHHILNQYNLKAEDCIFIDDRIENVKAANALGIQGLFYTTATACEKELTRLLGLN